MGKNVFGHSSGDNQVSRCLVTGAAGFIGSHLVDRLVYEGHDVIAIDNESAESNKRFYWNAGAENHVVDITDYIQIKDLFKDVEFVFHLASDARIQASFENPEKSIDVNCIGTLNVLNASANENISRVIFASTSSAYGNTPYLPNKETDKNDCLTPYSATKVLAENLCKIYNDNYYVETITLRYFNVYGERQPGSGEYATVIGKFFDQKQKGLPLTVYGGAQKRDFTHISDITNANILAMSAELNRHDTGQIYNIGTGKSFSILEVCGMISDTYEILPPRRGEAIATQADISRAKKVLGWCPKVELYDWIKKQNA